MTGVGPLGAASLATEYADELLLGAVRDLHAAIAGRIDRVLDLALRRRAGLRARAGIAGGVYASIGLGLRTTAGVLRAADRVAAHAGVGSALEDSARGRVVLAAVNGLIGDRLAEERPEHSFDLTLRRRGRDVSVTPAGLADAFPGATDALVVFIHGMSESEYAFTRGRDEVGKTYADTVRGQGWTPVFVRYNSGLPIARNGVALASMLDRLVADWPVAVRRIALVGHSMGGLVVRSACAVATDTVEPWADRVTDIVTLGTPHLGAGLAQVVDVGAKVLARVPEGAPFGRILDARAAGVHDLVRGLPAEVTNLPRTRYHLVGATLSRSLRHPVAETLGDLLVSWSSATGRPRRGAEMFPGADTVHLAGCDHFDLLNHEDVHDALRGWLPDVRPAATRPA